MESIVSYFALHGMDFWSIMKICGVILLGTLLISTLARFIFGKKSLLNHSVSSAIGILFLYIATIVLVTFAPQFRALIAPLPFATINDSSLWLFSFQSSNYADICSQLLSLIILAFFMNIADNWLPTGKNIVSWLFFRIITVALGLVLHGVITHLFVTYLPGGIVTYAPTVLLAILILMLLTGALKVIVGLIVATVNPLIAVLYTFFFASFVGKQITKAVLTTALIAGLVYLMEHIGIVSLSIAAGALVAYIPFVLVLIAMWYMVHRVM